MKNPKACGARRIVLDQVTTVGQVQLLARDQVQSGHVSVNGLDIIAADALNRPEHPHKYGVDVPPGAFTLWNLQPNVDWWIAEAEINSHGPSGIGFVNFGTIHILRVERTIETFGRGARGFNAYDGVMDTAEFERIVTHAEAGLGVQISRPVVRLIVHKGITTHGGVGETLLKGVIVQLPAYGLSVQPGGVVDEVIIDRGSIVTEGDNVISLQVQGKIGALRVRDGIHAAGHGSDAAHVEGGSVSLEGLALMATDGCALRLKDATLTALRATTARGASGDVVVASNSQVFTDAGSVDDLTGAFGNAFTVSGSATLQLHG